MAWTSFPLQLVHYTLSSPFFASKDASVLEWGDGEIFFLLLKHRVMFKRPDKGAGDLTVGSWLEDID